MNAIDHAYGENLPEVPIVLDNIKQYLFEHKYNALEDIGMVTLYNGKTYELSVHKPKSGYVGAIHLANEIRSISFDSIAELRGFLRGGGNSLY